MLEDKNQEADGFLESIEEQPQVRDIFSNEQVYVHEVPTTAMLEYSGLEPAYRNVSLLSTSIFFLVLTGIWVGMFLGGVDIAGVGLDYGWLIIVALYLFSIAIVMLGFKKKSYALRERDIVYNEGLIWQSSIVVPFNRVQHCEVSQGPIERLFGLSELKIFTAGGSSSDLSIPGLSPDSAERLKDYIVNKTGQDEEE